MNITGKELKQWGLKSGPVYKVLMDILGAMDLHRKQAKSIVKAIIKNPESYLKDGDWSEVAKLLVKKEDEVIKLKEKGCPIKIYGKHMIDPKAIAQMEIASRLPISVKSALLPDCHLGYGVPIGSALCVNDAILPFAVGYDISCQMQMTVTDIDVSEMEGMRGKLRNVLVKNTFFGVGCKQDGKNDADMMYDDRFNIPALKGLKDKARNGLGSSGSSNHFVSYGKAKIEGIDGEWLAILSHSGSRGFGYGVAKHYIGLAKESCKLPKEAQDLAWLSMDSEAGQEYWEAMSLAGDYSSASHNIIHNRIVTGLGCEVKNEYGNRHNFAWKEKIELNGEIMDAIIHRKGATPAGLGVTGIIPSSMSTPAYLVEGKGCEESLCSSSHGTGRMISRTKAKETFTMSAMKQDLLDRGVELIGGGLDECSFAYKGISEVMEEQKDLVSIKGVFNPWMCRMAKAEKKKW